METNIAELYPFSYDEFATKERELSENQIVRMFDSKQVKKYKKNKNLNGYHGIGKLSDHTYGVNIKIEDYPFYIYRFFAPQNYIFLNPNPEIDYSDEATKTLDIPASFALMREPFAISDLFNILNTKLMPNPYDDLTQFYRTAFLRWFWWSGLCDSILSFLSILSETLLFTRNFGINETRKEPIVGGFFTLITGGLALRSYYPSHYSDDIDVKFFPRNMTAGIDSDRFFNDLLLWMNELMLPYLNIYGKFLLQTYLQVVLQFPEIRQNVMMQYIYFELVHSSPEDFSIEFSKSPTPNILVYKLIVRFKGVIYPIADFTLYNSNDKVYNNLIRESREKCGDFDTEKLKEYGTQYTFYDPEKQLIPFNVVSNAYIIPEIELDTTFKMAFNPISLNREVLDTVEQEGNIGTINGVNYRKTIGYFMIPTKEYLQAEKEILLNDLPNPEEFDTIVENPEIIEGMETPYFRFNRPRNASENKFFVDKFSKTLQTMQDNKDELLEKVYIGGDRSE